MAYINNNKFQSLQFITIFLIKKLMFISAKTS